MNSISKNRLNERQINALTLRAFGKQVVHITENNSGMFSAIYLVTLRDIDVVLKVAPKDNVKVLTYEKDLMRAEVEALRLVSERTGVPVPEVLYYDTTKELCDSEYFFMEKVTGADFKTLSASLNTEQKSDIIHEIGRLNRQINEISGKSFGYLAQAGKQGDNWKIIFESMIYNTINDGKAAGIELSVPYDKVEGIIDRFLFSCEDVQTPKLVHWDIWPGNVLIHNGRINGIIDFERSLWADPLMEYYFRKFSQNDNFCAGYGIDLSTLDKNSRIRLALYDLYLALILKIECYYREYDNMSQNTWADGQIISICEDFGSF